MALSNAKRFGEPVEERYAAVADYYESLFSQPADLPDCQYAPARIGPTWQLGEDGRWLLPERSLGMAALTWCGVWLQHGPGEPWRFTPEQARFLMHWYALDDSGRFLYRDGVLQRIKGWGKDPLGACILAFEALGPARFSHWDGDVPVAKDVHAAWVQTAAVALSQTRNTMQLFDAGLFTDEAIKRFRLHIGIEVINAVGGRRIQAVTSSPSVLQGNRASFVLLNETHEWTAANGGHRMSETLKNNATKSPDGAARTLRITNAYQPGQDSVAERDRGAYEQIRAGRAVDVGLLYDSLEAGPETPLTAEGAREAVPAIRGDSTWLVVDRIVDAILDWTMPPSQSRRFWYNQITAAEDSWVTPQQWDANRVEGLTLNEGDQIVLFFDGSKSDDATGLEACRISDGAVFTIGVWQRPEHTAEWSVPRDAVRDMVARAFALYDVRAMFADPGAGEDDLGERYWDSTIDSWGQEYGDRLDVKAVESGPDRHPILWDMRSPTRQRLFTEACERALSDILNNSLPHDGNLIKRMHVTNARRRPSQYGTSISKESRESKRKIDLAVCMIGARMLRRMWEALPDNRKQKRKTGKAVFL